MEAKSKRPPLRWTGQDGYNGRAVQQHPLDALRSYDECQRYLRIIRRLERDRVLIFAAPQPCMYVHRPVIGEIRFPRRGMSLDPPILAIPTKQDCDRIRWHMTHCLILNTTHAYYFRQHEEADSVEVTITDKDLEDRREACKAAVIALLGLSRRCAASSLECHANAAIAQELWTTRWDIQWTWWYDAKDPDHSHESPPWGAKKKRHKVRPLADLFKA